MEGKGGGGGGGEDSRGHRHGQAERGNGERTSKTPSHREVNRTYEEIHLSGKVSREKTPTMGRDGDKTPNYDQRRASASQAGKAVSSAEKYIHKRIRSVERGDRIRKRESGKRKHDADEDNICSTSLVNQCGSGSNSVAISRQSLQTASSYYGSIKHVPTNAPTRKSTELQNRNKQQQGKVCDEKSTEDTVCSIFRGRWNDHVAPGIKLDNVSASTSSVVQRFVHAQTKALEGFSDISNAEDTAEVSTEFKPKVKDFTQRKAIAAVLAFQRWRHTQLKKLFSMELKKVLEESKQDEACLVKLEQELGTKDKLIAQLRSQLASHERLACEQMRHKQTTDDKVKQLEKELLKTLERAASVEGDLHTRDSEIRRLKDRLTSLEKEGVRIDSELQTSFTALQNDKESALNEGRVLLAQLARRDEEVAAQCREIGKLRATLVKLTERQTSQQKEMANTRADHKTHLRHLQEKLRQASDAVRAKEMELISYTERCSGLAQERENLLIQLQHTADRADIASRRAEELQERLNCTAEHRAKASQEVAGEMVEHLKRLTDHMKNLETSVDKTTLGFPMSVFQKKAVAASLAKLSSKIAQAEKDCLDLKHHTARFEEIRRPGRAQEHESKKQVSFSDSNNRTKCRPSHCGDGEDNYISTIGQGTALKKLENWTVWKWRWAASATRAKNLSTQLCLVESLSKYRLLQERETGSGTTVSEETRLSSKQLKSSEPEDLARPLQKKLGSFILRHNLVPLILSAWRTFTRLSNLERKAISRNKSLEKIISALPWWIRRVGERRSMERYFFHWQLLALRANRSKVQPAQQPHQPLKHKMISPVSPKAQGNIQGHQESPAPTTTTKFQDAQIQTCIRFRDTDVDKKQKTCTAFGISNTTQRPRSEPATAPGGCHKCDMHSGYSAGGPHTLRFKEPKNGSNKFTSKALHTLQNSLQQELTELQYLLSREMQNKQQITAKQEDPGRIFSGGPPENNKQALTSVFRVCNNLAQALTEVHERLCGTENQLRTSARLSTPQTPKLGINDRTARSTTRHPEAQDEREGGQGSMTRQTLTTGQMLTTGQTSFGQRIPRYALPIGRATRFNSSNSLQQREVRPLSSTYITPHTQDDQSLQGNIGGKYLPSQEGRDYSNGHQPLSSATSRITKSIAISSDGNICTPSSKATDCSHTTVVQILNQDNNKIGEVAIHTHPLSGGRDVPDYTLRSESCSGRDEKRGEKGDRSKGEKLETQQENKKTDLKPSFQAHTISTVDEKPSVRPTTPAPHHQPIVKKNNAVDRVDTTRLLSSLKRKSCIGSEYAALLKSEILRLREGRLLIEDKLLQAGCDVEKEWPLIKKPSWKSHY